MCVKTKHNVLHKRVFSPGCSLVNYYGLFAKGLPLKFCEEHLPRDGINIMVLEDESGREYEATYISKRTGLSGGWRAFALDHKLDDGDALVFELYQPTSFKVS